MNSQTQDSQASGSELTVHHWIGPDVDSIPSQDALDLGRRLVDAATLYTEWHEPKPYTEVSDINIRDNCYLFSLEAPKPLIRDDVDTSKLTCPLKEWGADVDTNEVFSMDDLDEFDNTDVESVLQAAREILAGGTGIESAQNIDQSDRVAAGERQSPSTVHVRDSREVLDEEPPRKRPRLDNNSLYNLVPQPHFFGLPPTTLLSPPPEVQLSTLQATRKSKPIPPHTVDSVNELLDDPFARGAWIIPVRGISPWDGCTSASMLVDGSFQGQSDRVDEDRAHALLPRGPSRKAADPLMSGITWTHDALLDFWTFLLSLQKAQTLGPIALSFHTAPVARVDRSSNGVPPTGHAQETVSSYADQRLTGSVPRAHPTLLSIDHIKVYHDVRYSMPLRNVLSAWWYKYPKAAPTPATSGVGDGVGGQDAVPQVHDRPASHLERAEDAAPERVSDVNAFPLGDAGAGDCARRIKLFKGAKLALVDERSRGVLTS